MEKSEGGVEEWSGVRREDAKSSLTNIEEEKRAKKT